MPGSKGGYVLVSDAKKKFMPENLAFPASLIGLEKIDDDTNTEDLGKTDSDNTNTVSDVSLDNNNDEEKKD